MSFNKDLQELLNSTLQGAKLRGETETATKLTRAIKMLEEDNAKKSQDFREGAAKVQRAPKLNYRPAHRQKTFR